MNRRKGVCSVSAMCGDGFCCMYSGGCFCSHYECYGFCSHGDNIKGTNQNEKIQRRNSAAHVDSISEPSHITFLDHSNQNLEHFENDQNYQDTHYFPIPDNSNQFETFNDVLINDESSHFPMNDIYHEPIDDTVMFREANTQKDGYTNPENPINNKISMVPLQEHNDEFDENNDEYHPTRVLDRSLQGYKDDEKINKQMRDQAINGVSRKKKNQKMVSRLKMIKSLSKKSAIMNNKISQSEFQKLLKNGNLQVMKNSVNLNKSKFIIVRVPVDLNETQIRMRRFGRFAKKRNQILDFSKVFKSENSEKIDKIKAFRNIFHRF